MFFSARMALPASSPLPPVAWDFPSSDILPEITVDASAAVLKLNQVLLPIRSPPTVTFLSKLTIDAAVVLPLPKSDPEIAVPSATDTCAPASTMTSPSIVPDTLPSLYTAPDISRDQ